MKHLLSHWTHEVLHEEQTKSFSNTSLVLVWCLHFGQNIFQALLFPLLTFLYFNNFL